MFWCLDAPYWSLVLDLSSTLRLAFRRSIYLASITYMLAVHRQLISRALPLSIRSLIAIRWAFDYGVRGIRVSIIFRLPSACINNGKYWTGSPWLYCSLLDIQSIQNLGYRGTRLEPTDTRHKPYRIQGRNVKETNEICSLSYPIAVIRGPKRRLSCTNAR